MRAVNSSDNHAGPPAQWPQSLRACVRVVPGSGHPMLVSQGGPDYTMGPDYTIRYNEPTSD
jgi:hypothetical protein